MFVYKLVSNKLALFPASSHDYCVKAAKLTDASVLQKELNEKVFEENLECKQVFLLKSMLSHTLFAFIGYCMQFNFM